jgi:uncharacterized protein
MSGPAAENVLDDPAGFARSAGKREGRLPIAALGRVRDVLADTAGSVRYVIRGGLDVQGRPKLELEVSGKLRLHCARCSDPLDHRLELTTRLLLAQAGEMPPVDDDPDAPEWIEAGLALDLPELVEDEILLGLPLSVRHEQGGCGSPMGGGRDGNAPGSPFAGLADLLLPGRTNKD